MNTPLNIIDGVLDQWGVIRKNDRFLSPAGKELATNYNKLALIKLESVDADLQADIVCLLLEAFYIELTARGIEILPAKVIARRIIDS